jgi:ligand-binding SRPBCC domain-containing protein
MHSFEIESELAAEPNRVWQHVVTPRGINHELMPIIGMTVPRPLRHASIDELPLGQPLGRSWMLLFGFLPVDFDQMTIAELEPGRRFLERSTMLSQSQWSHERIIEPCNGGCRVIDRLSWQGRLAILAVLFDVVVPVLFRHRHRRLRRRFGGSKSLRQ